MKYFVRLGLIAGVCIQAAIFPAGPARAMDTMYSPAALAKEAPRLRRAAQKIFRQGIAPHLTTAEKNALGRVVLEFPLPEPGSDLLNFYAYRKGSQAVVVLPLLSLKQLEDMTTAYAWIQANGGSHSRIDLYYAMLRHKPKSEFPKARYPNILEALRIPPTAWKDPKVDKLSLSLRNEAIAFIELHELAHVLYRHLPYAKVSRAKARADELEADRFALRVMARTKTPPMGAMVFFQAQVYAMPHRGQFNSKIKWLEFLRKTATHPLSTQRISNLAANFAGPVASTRPSEATTWRWIGRQTLKMNTILKDVGIQRCVARTAKNTQILALGANRNRHIGLEACHGR